MTLQHKNILDLLQNNKKQGIAVYSNKSHHYSELHLFRQQIETENLGPDHRPYTAQKKNVRTYQTIFYAIGLLYSTLGIGLYYKPFTWTYTFLFGIFSLPLKSLVCVMCAVAAIITLGLAYSMRTEKEVTKSLYKKAKLRLKQSYERKMVQFGINRYLAIGEERKKVHAFRQMYEDSLEKLHDQRDEATHLLERISRSDSLDGERKERLFNQAILEMYDRMSFVVDTFKSTNHKRLLSSPAAS